MDCKNCGKEVEEGKEYCVDCEPKEEAVIEETTTQEVDVETETVEEPKVENKTETTNTTSAELKSKMAAGLLGIFLGAFGVHNFYLGYTGKAIAQLLITVLSCFTLSVVSEIWGLIEGILILTGSMNTDADGNPLKD